MSSPMIDAADPRLGQPPRDQGPAEETRLEPAIERSRPLRLLLVEDNPDDVFFIREMLADADLEDERFAGVDLVHVDRLAAADEALDGAQAFDVVLLDLSLPDADGLETFERVRERTPDLPVVILSGLDDAKVALNAVRSGAQDYLVKGDLDAATLGRAIRYALERFRYTDAYRSSHERFQRTLAEATQASLVLEPDGAVLFVNDAASEVLGEAPAEVTGRRPRLELAGPASDGEGSLALELSGRGEVRLPVRVTDTVWEGRIARLVSLDRAGGEAAASVPADFDLAAPPGEDEAFEGMISASPAMRALFETCQRVAPTEATVLLLGETGTGKELLARAVHERSGREGPFVAINCGAVPDTLIEAELFGHEKGAFTGATASKPGLFRQAHGGTLLLDEVVDLTPSAQVSLLRTLQERTVRPVGGAKEVEVDVRVLAATSSDLFDAVRDGRFRQDLLYRLDVIRLEVLPLRQRPEDVVHLFRLFCRELSRRHGVELPSVGQGFLEAMLAHPWPGNVRQLENFTERLLLMGGECLTARQFHELVRPYQQPAPAGAPGEVPAGAAPVQPSQSDLEQPLVPFMERMERVYLEELLRSHKGRIIVAAEQAGISRRTLLRKIKKHGLDKDDYK